MEIKYLRIVAVIGLTCLFCAFTRCQDVDVISPLDQNNRIDQSTSGQIKSKAEQNQKPLFKKCTQYNPVVKEEQEKETFVITVEAMDPDPPGTDAAKLTYNIESQPEKTVYFYINNITGDIYTFRPIDRDNPDNPKEMYLTIRAADNGWPTLADICTFKVTIEDINDNSPIFDQSEYNRQIPADSAINQEVLRVVAYDVDSGENARLSFTFADSFSQSADSLALENYFKIDSATGVVYLLKPLTGKSGYVFSSTVTAQDHGRPPRSATVAIQFTVVDSGKSPPRIRVQELRPLELPENFFDIQTPLIQLIANGNSDGSVIFDMIKGKTKETNSEDTFIFSPESETRGVIKLARHLDYEQVTKYTLTITATNRDNLASSVIVKINVTDVNDEIPSFIDTMKGSIVENNEIGAPALSVKALDNDGTSPNNQVRYKLLSHQDLFDIDEIVGTVTAKKKFDREEENIYHINIQAYDGNVSALSADLPFNSANKTYQITIEDQNDNSPEFNKRIYNVYNISENRAPGQSVIEVRAIDRDTASRINYTIIGGNIDDAFEIEVTTGRIKVKNKLDYEKQKSYNLTVRAFDGIYGDEVNVVIEIFNENDEAPVFLTTNGTITIEEESIPEGCLIQVKAYDPDTSPDRPERIEYVVRENFLSVDPNDGCVRLTKARNRDPPDGVETEQAFVYAYDKNPGENTQAYLELTIHITDINDNAPFLKQSEVVWYENEPPGRILDLEAEDYDGPTNRGPFIYNIPENVLTDLFYIDNSKSLYARKQFDREQQKYYDVPINIIDSGEPPKSAISILKVIIGDRNDNKAENGTSEIFVYKYEGFKTDTKIGRVYVNDLDDWDLPDKEFEADGFLDASFELSTTDKGMIVMRRSALPDTYTLHFKVTEHFEGTLNVVYADVKVVIKEIPTEAVRKSGSIRLKGKSEDFIVKDPTTNLSKKDLLQKYMAKTLNTSEDNVDVFTVMPSPYNSTYFDVRFSAHGSPYYAPERLNKKTASEQDQLERNLDFLIVMIDINECLNSSHCTNSSCTNTMSIKDDAAVVFTNKTSFVGVKAVMEPICECKTTYEKTCYNGGTLIEDSICDCPEGFEGPNCESTGISFSGNGWALYPSFDSCNQTVITLNVLTQTDNGLIFYAGPVSWRESQNSKSFIALEVRNGFIVLKIDVGAGIDEIVQDYKKINDGAIHQITIKFSLTDVQVEIDICSSECLKWKSLTAPGILRVNGPLQVGGRVEQFSLGSNSPTSRPFTGCITNLTYNGYLYNLGEPSDKLNSLGGACNFGTFQAATFGIDSNFLVAILVCIAILLCLLLAVVVHKRKQHNMHEKEMDDTRENIINYEDEGGGECDTNFDLSVLRNNYGDEKLSRDNLYKQAPEVPADIGTFLDDKKRTCDKDALPYDDVRHYAYEGDGNSSGSLSSLASCTDDGDLKFNYLSSFGPRFRKLADMYGDDGSDI